MNIHPLNIMNFPVSSAYPHLSIGSNQNLNHIISSGQITMTPKPELFRAFWEDSGAVYHILGWPQPQISYVWFNHHPEVIPKSADEADEVYDKNLTSKVHFSNHAGLLPPGVFRF